ncbi:hypothetical protein AVEN_137951-1 [Araneus ventricosus]|uniref:Uncharacterized protein n=1 Tax=Araneus ventricosus TaxID=182803 RepID=A0A4Y2SQ49_ARAVE|nr:hypothetical protein AVEN_137951-1 [Araneus ventricosus]
MRHCSSTWGKLKKRAARNSKFRLSDRKNNSAYYEQYSRRPLRQRYDASSAFQMFLGEIGKRGEKESTDYTFMPICGTPTEDLKLSRQRL